MRFDNSENGEPTKEQEDARRPRLHPAGALTARNRWCYLEIVRLEKSLQMRRDKALNRARDRRLLARGELRIQQISMAAALGNDFRKSPLILKRVRLGDSEGF